MIGCQYYAFISQIKPKATGLHQIQIYLSLLLFLAEYWELSEYTAFNWSELNFINFSEADVFSKSMTKFSSHKLSKRFGKVAVLIGISFSGATIANYINHASYWKKTIPRVQTVDFNILSHVLPTKLSYALLQENEEEIQKTLNSNYGLSGLIVTDCQTVAQDCPSQQILYASQGRFDYKTELRPEELIEHPFDSLRDPPPLLTEATYAHSHATVRDKTGKTNPGNHWSHLLRAGHST